MIYIRQYLSPLGGITLSSDGEALTGLWFDGQRYFPDLIGAVRQGHLSVLDEAVRWLDLYFSRKDPGFTPPLRPLGATPFRQAVWESLLKIPYGETSTYGQIAELLGLSGGAQAVGAAVGHNPISLIIPCHRVLGASGSLVGYAGGLDRKAALLRLEGIIG